MFIDIERNDKTVLGCCNDISAAVREKRFDNQSAAQVLEATNHPGVIKKLLSAIEKSENPALFKATVLNIADRREQTPEIISRLQKLALGGEYADELSAQMRVEPADGRKYLASSHQRRVVKEIGFSPDKWHGNPLQTRIFSKYGKIILLSAPSEVRFVGGTLPQEIDVSQSPECVKLGFEQVHLQGLCPKIIGAISEICFSECAEMPEEADLSHCDNLKTLEFDTCQPQNALEKITLKAPPQLESLILYKCCWIKNGQELLAHPNLTVLRIGGAQLDGELPAMSPKLKELALVGCSGYPDKADFSSYAELEELRINGGNIGNCTIIYPPRLKRLQQTAGRLGEHNGLAHLSELETLCLDMADLEEYKKGFPPSLRELSLKNSIIPPELDLSNLQNLQQLNLTVYSNKGVNAADNAMHIVYLPSHLKPADVPHNPAKIRLINAPHANPEAVCQRYSHLQPER